MSHFENLNINELKDLLYSRGVKIENLKNRKIFLRSLAKYLESGNISIIHDNSEELEDHLQEFKNRIRELEEDVKEKSHQINRLKNDYVNFNNIAQEAEEAYNKKINEQNATILDLRNEVINLKKQNSEVLDKSCEDCELYKRKIHELNTNMMSKSSEFDKILSETALLKDKLNSAQLELATIHESNTRHVNNKDREDIDNKTSSHRPNKVLKNTNTAVLDNCHRKKQILLLSDSQGRRCGEILKILFDKIYNTICITKANALMEDVVQDIVKLTKNFTKQDYVILLAGSNNASSKKFITKSFLQHLKNSLSHTNIIFIFTPFWKYHTDFNTTVLQNNLDIYASFRNSATFIDPNTFLSVEEFTRHGLHLNYNGKLKIFNKVKDVITNNKNNPTNPSFLEKRRH